ncbi:hypothetical protein DXG01_011640 [Tephrocybe rancida]|nr:hypothetical protein DXG01_011640 [Tephrocybe rancida]
MGLRNHPSKGGAPRYQAPELHQPEFDEAEGSGGMQNSGVIHNTPQSNVFSLGCLLYEAFTGCLPFFYPSYHTVIYKVMSGETPSRPPKGSDVWLENGLTEDIWDTMEGCWKFDPSERLDVRQFFHDWTP